MAQISYHGFFLENHDSLFYHDSLSCWFYCFASTAELNSLLKTKNCKVKNVLK